MAIFTRLPCIMPAYPIRVGAVLLAASPLHGAPWWLLWGVAGAAGAWALAQAGRAAPSKLPTAA